MRDAYSRQQEPRMPASPLVAHQRKLRRSRDTWRAWALTLAMVLTILVMALIAQGCPL
jgi:hypothetical protein